MDDILKRMMAVEAEAEEIVKAAEKEGDVLRSEARKDANLYLAEAQKKLALEIEAYKEERLAKANADEKAALEAGDNALKDNLSVFEKRIATRQNEITQLLLFPEIKGAN